MKIALAGRTEAVPTQGIPQPDVVRERSIGLFTFLKAYSGLRTKVTRSVDQYEKVIWLDDLPRIPGFFCAAHSGSERDSELWVQLKRPRPPKPPPRLPEELANWIDHESLFDAAGNGPALREAIALDPDDDQSQDWITAADHPELDTALETYANDYWRGWAAENQIAVVAQAIYNELFSIHTKQQRLGETFEVVLGLGLLTWRTESGHEIRRHLLTAQTDVQFEPTNGTITVRAAGDGAELELEEDMLDVGDTPDIEERVVISSLLLDIGDDVFGDPNIPAALSAWVNSVSASGTLDASEPRPGPTGPDPFVALAPALILRRRGDRSIMRAMEEIVAQLKAGESIPEGVRRFVQIEEAAGSSAAGEAGSHSDIDSDSRLYFPLPANEEQREIVRRLQGRQGVLVQGPPGTGKSHTIANIVCHLLAQGQRILITSHAARALEVLKDKIPQEVQALAVIVLGNDSKALERLQSSVQGINDRYARWDPDRSNQLQLALATQLDQRAGRNAELLGDIRSLRERDTYRHPPLFGGYTGTEQQIASRLAAEEDSYAWVGTVEHTEESAPLSDAEALEVLELLRKVPPTRDAELALTMPPSGDLPTPTEFSERMQEEAETEVAWEALACDPADPLLQALEAAPNERVAAYGQALSDLHSVTVRLRGHRESWLDEAVQQVLADRGGRWQELKRSTEAIVATLQPELASLPRDEPAALVGRDLAAVETDARTLLDRLKTGKGMGLGPFRPAIAKQAAYIRSGRVDGMAGDSPEAILKLLVWIEVHRGIRELAELWSGLTALPTGSAAVQIADYSDLATLLDDVLHISANVGTAARAAQAIDGVQPPAWHVENAIDVHLAAVHACRLYRAHQEVKSSIDHVAAAIGAAAGGQRLHPTVGRLQHALTRRNRKSYAVEYQALMTLLDEQRARSRRESLLQRLDGVLPELRSELVKTASSDHWQARLAGFEAAFNWGRADRWLTERADPLLNQRLLSQIDENASEMTKLLRDLAAERAWASCLSKLSPLQRASLAAWQLEIRRIGKGTGKHAPRHRRRAREYMNDCRGAIPAWIMPIYRVAETMAIQPDSFDTIIVDEASQSGPEALFLQYLGKKVIVVGDDQQISPNNVGLDRNEVSLLAERYLRDVPLGQTFAGDGSLFDHAAIRYPDKLALREHFRCMPEIIQFSNNLCYSDRPLIPLRQFDGSRLTPVIETRHIASGYLEDTQNVNKPEAEALVSQVHACIQDPAYRGKSFGVISLVGDRQAVHIEKLLAQRIGADEMEARRIVCGDAYAFQGDERDVMFLSLVQAPRAGRPLGSLTTEQAKQRFNVAASRAKDQVWLFHTVTLNDLSRAGMPYRLLEYYLDPAVEPGGASHEQIASVRARASDARRSDGDPPPPFESWFEVDVFLRLVDRGFRVIPQYELAGYRIDLMVEGVAGRLAVECDGDYWHGEDRFEEDAGRQRVLERCGLRFSRIRGTAFYRDPDSALQPLWDELVRLRIFASVSEAEAAGAVTRHPQLGGTGTPEGPAIDSGVSTKGDVVGSSRPYAEGLEQEDLETEANGSAPKATTLPLGFDVEEYEQYRPSGLLPDPRYVGPRNLVGGLVEIVQAEGPIVCERLLQTYVKSAGSSRVSSVMRSALLAALAQAKRDGLVQGRHELSEEGQPLAEVVRLAGADKVRLRTRGNRTFFEIPSSEVGRLMRMLQQRNRYVSREELLRLTLDALDLRRMTSGVEQALGAIHRKYCEGAMTEASDLAATSTNLRAANASLDGVDAPPCVGDLPKHPITAQGLHRLEQELEQLTNITVPDLIEHHKAGDAIGMGLADAQQRLSELGMIIDEASVVASSHLSDHVRFGSGVQVATPDGDQDFVIVGPAEADFGQGRLNVQSGLALALYGHKVGDVVQVRAPAGSYHVTILNVAASADT